MFLLLTFTALETFSLSLFYCLLLCTCKTPDRPPICCLCASCLHSVKIFLSVAVGSYFCIEPRLNSITRLTRTHQRLFQDDLSKPAQVR